MSMCYVSVCVNPHLLAYTTMVCTYDYLIRFGA